MRMLKYKCLLCGRVHYGRADLKPGYCTTCGPKGRLIWVINYDKVCKTLAGIMERAADSIRDLSKVFAEANRRKQ